MTLGASSAPLLLLGLVAVVALAVATPRSPGLRFAVAGLAVVAGFAALGAGVFLAVGAAVTAWDGHPALVRDLAIVVALLLLAASVGVRRAAAEPGHPDEDDDESGGGGGGGWRPPTSPAPVGPPPADHGRPDVPWADFDAVRADWGRAPAGRR